MSAVLTGVRTKGEVCVYKGTPGTNVRINDLRLETDRVAASMILLPAMVIGAINRLIERVDKIA